MEKQQILERSQEILSSFETENIVRFMKELTLKTVVDNPWILGLLLAVFFFAVIKRSKFVLLFLFTLLSLIALVQYSLPAGAELTVTCSPPLCIRLHRYLWRPDLLHLHQGGITVAQGRLHHNHPAGSSGCRR